MDHPKIYKDFAAKIVASSPIPASTVAHFFDNSDTLIFMTILLLILFLFLTFIFIKLLGVLSQLLSKVAKEVAQCNAAIVRKDLDKFKKADDGKVKKAADSKIKKAADNKIKKEDDGKIKNADDSKVKNTAHSQSMNAAKTEPMLHSKCVTDGSTTSSTRRTHIPGSEALRNRKAEGTSVASNTKQGTRICEEHTQSAIGHAAVSSTGGDGASTKVHRMTTLETKVYASIKVDAGASAPSGNTVAMTRGTTATDTPNSSATDIPNSTATDTPNSTATDTPNSTATDTPNSTATVAELSSTQKAYSYLAQLRKSRANNISKSSADKAQSRSQSAEDGEEASVLRDSLDIASKFADE